MRSIDAESPGARLQAARKRAGMTQVQLQAKTGVLQSTISEFESGANKDMDASSLVKLCKAAGVTVEYVMLGAVADADHEAEALALLRHAAPEDREMAMRSLRGMLDRPATPSRKRSNGPN